MVQATAVLEREPNNAPEEANTIRVPALVKGTLGHNDQDGFVWELSDTDAQQLWELSWQGDQSYLQSLTVFSLSDSLPPAELMKLNKPPGQLQFSHRNGSVPVLLPPGRYMIGLAGDGDYVLKVEPADELKVASSLPKQLRIGSEHALYLDVTPDKRVALPENPGHLMSASLRSYPNTTCALALYSDDEQLLQRAYCDKLGYARLSNLSIDRKGYTLAIEDAETAQLWLVDNGPINAGFEVEPNSSASTAMHLDAHLPIGGVTSRGDRDLFRLESQGEPLGIEFEGMQAGTGKLVLLDNDRQKLLTRQGPLPLRVTPLSLPSGTYQLELSANETALPYRIRVRSERLTQRSEREPNDDTETANTLHASGIARGQLSPGETDVFAFEVSEPQYYRIQATGDGIQDLYLLDSLGTKIANARHGRSSHDRLRLDALYLLPGVHWLGLKGEPKESGRYLLRVFPQGEKPPGYEREPNDTRGLANPLSDNFVNRGLLNRKDDIDQFRFSVGQPSEAVFAVEYPMGKLTWELHWGVTRIASEQALGSESIPKKLVLEPGDYTLTLQAKQPSEEEYRVSVSVVPTPEQHTTQFELPLEMMGHVNQLGGNFSGRILSANTGAVAAPRESGSYEGLEFLIDGYAVPGQVFSTKDASFSPVLDIGEVREISGFSFHPMVESTNRPDRLLREYRVFLGEDAEKLSLASEGTLSARQQKQYVMLDSPQNARYIKLEFISNHSNDPRNRTITLGEFGAYSPQQGSALVNLLASDKGGHVVSVDPPLASFSRDHQIIGEGEPLIVRVNNQPLQWVVGFHQNRLAEIDRIEWLSPERDTGEPSVLVEASTQSTVTGWRTLGTLDLEQRHAKLHFEQPQSARFLRFTRRGDTEVSGPEELIVAPHPEKGDSVFALVKPRKSDRNSSKFSAGAGNDALAPADANDVNTSAISGKVQLGKKEEVHPILVRAPQNSVFINLASDLLERLRIRLRTMGDAHWLPLTKHETDDYYSAYLPPGEYELVIDEPPRSIVLAWDTSSSTLPYRSEIDQAARDFSSHLSPGHEALNLLPFGGEFLFQQWQSDHEAILWRLNHRLGRRSSSSTEQYLALASQALAEREGQRIVVLVTDGLSPKYSPLWQTLAQVQPKVHVLDVIHASGMMGSSAGDSKNRLRDYAWINHGSYTEVSSASQAQEAFESVMAGWETPVNYTGYVSTAELAQPEPGWLVVADDNAKRLLYVIVDGSGSMLKRDASGSRIDQAKRAVEASIGRESELLTMLRFFGHTAPGSCDTQLITASAVRGEQLMAQLEKLAPRNLAKTPIAASISGAKKDLAKQERLASVLLVTDGEETCGGDPEKAIVEFRAALPQVPINIIGFQIEDGQYISSLENWAVLGGGRYVSAGDQQQLVDAMTVLSKFSYVVTTGLGEHIAQGVSGEPLELMPGDYVIHFDSGQTASATISSGNTSVLSR
ncbi:MAG: VWA domain-containing protein [Pseudomonadota bacterium]